MDIRKKNNNDSNKTKLKFMRLNKNNQNGLFDSSDNNNKKI